MTDEKILVLEQVAATVDSAARPGRGPFIALGRKGSSSRFTALRRRGAGVRAVKLALCAALLATAARAQSSGDWRIDTFAGLAHVRDNVPATEDRLAAPHGVATDSAGNLYIADAANHCIRKVDPSGIITTVAGTGESGYGGDGGPATEGRLDHPWDVAADAVGNVYIVDWGNDRIRILMPPPIPSAIPTVVNQLDFIFGSTP